MSIAKDGQYIVCDGEGCSASARLPVALRPTLVATLHDGTETVEGWLFVGVAGRHFCPLCARRFLDALSEVADRQQLPEAPPEADPESHDL